MKLSVLIPVYNEKNTILDVIKAVKAVKIPKEIILVDDCSKDGTREILKGVKDKEVKVFYHEVNRGKGMAIRTAIEHMTGDIAIIQDADMEYDPNDYHILVEPILHGHYSVVYGSRFINNQNNLPFTRHMVATKILNIASNVLYNARITDEPTCYKVFKADVLKNMKLDCERFEFCPEVTAKVRKAGYEIYEVPIAYKPRSIKEGKKIRWTDGFQALWTLIKYRFVD
ncbi:MAG: glycosyltransferase family 2 protein [Nanoarchaeota archaeon]